MCFNNNNKKSLKLILLWKKYKVVCEKSDIHVGSSGYFTLSGCLATQNPAMSFFFKKGGQQFPHRLCQVLFIHSVIFGSEHLKIECEWNGKKGIKTV